MKCLNVIKIVFVFTLIYSASTSAGLIKYSYSSGSLDWQHMLIAGQDWEEILSEEDGEISFNFSVLVDESNISKSSITNVSFNSSEVNPDIVFMSSSGHAITHKTSGFLKLNPDKSISSWTLFFSINLKAFGDSDYVHRLTSHRIFLKSGGGQNTCNCDEFDEFTHFVIPRPHYTWIRASNGQSLYTSPSSFDNWSIESVAVSEPYSLGLLALGLIGLLIMRNKKLSNDANA